jgi:hypothetical protein
MLQVPQKSSATFEVGAPVKITSGVLVAVGVTASVGTGSNLSEVAAASISLIAGFSAGDAQSGATGSLGVHLIQEGMEFEGNLIHGTAASAKAAATRLLKHSASGGLVRLAKVDSDTHFGWALDASSTFTGSGASIVQGVITEFIDPASTVNGRVLVRITKGGALIT